VSGLHCNCSPCLSVGVVWVPLPSADIRKSLNLLGFDCPGPLTRVWDFKTSHAQTVSYTTGRPLYRFDIWVGRYLRRPVTTVAWTRSGTASIWSVSVRSLLRASSVCGRLDKASISLAQHSIGPALTLRQYCKNMDTSCATQHGLVSVQSVTCQWLHHCLRQVVAVRGLLVSRTLPCEEDLNYARQPQR